MLLPALSEMVLGAVTVTELEKTPKLSLTSHSQELVLLL
jgi:hypothetical protein